MFASIEGHAAAVRLLLERGALKHLVTHAGLTARDFAASLPLVLAELEEAEEEEVEEEDEEEE
jgi:ankyrin repeat protein